MYTNKMGNCYIKEFVLILKLEIIIMTKKFFIITYWTIKTI